MSKPSSLPPDERISEGAPRQIGVRWPAGVDQLLDALVARANEAGANCNRKELTAALVVESHALAGDQLRDILVRYRQARVTDILPATTDKDALPTRRGDRG
ncbi:hypothetical protein IU436_30020 [Nocardia farcinica]|uniref:hypothetical protein n=1 Tax=Nocardia farcinica TaxID=37329 RepID=UPI0018939723|nr:hypothetical protein [Nocardia farcinica]MBF6271610.1 hypothetical protein [Nocardia farcinica]MBF6422844.1 hypothetical protein [Nocardia farcinica]MBF6434556.1 hypothetical protein [Nocardia farcinica]MBF6505663.1 hypothetical protein [Nocardia farcinica]